MADCGVDRYLVDTRLCFGISCAPYIFQTISNFVVRCMNRHGFYRVFAYLDDYILVDDSFELCASAQLTLIRLLHTLGFVISWKKCNSPTRRIRFLGIVLDSISMKLILPEDKIQRLHRELEFFSHRSCATKKQLQRLCGYLAHCAKVIRGARTFSHRLIQLLRDMPEGNPRIRLTHKFLLDLDWWARWAPTFNGEACLIHKNFGEGPVVSTDSTLSGFGAVYNGDWLAGSFVQDVTPLNYQLLDHSHDHWQTFMLPDAPNYNINVCEFIPVYLAICRWGHLWCNKQVICLSDNTQTVQMINKGRNSSVLCMYYIREVFWWSVKFNCHLIAKHIPGITNTIPDLLSRLAQKKTGFINLHGTNLCCSQSSSIG